jgi:CubicO group peptidase (beta-lactamase class C family)
VRSLVVVALAIAIASAASGCRRERATQGGNADAGAAPLPSSAAVDARAPEDAVAETALAAARVPGLAFARVTRDGERVGAAGLARVAPPLDATGETVFEAASIAKLVVASCVMQLVEEGKLELDADAATYVGFALRHPAFPEPITLRMLLSHRAAIRDLDDELAARAEGNPLGAFLKRYLVRDGAPRAAAFLGDRPGTKLTYSNVGAAVAALAVERVAGESFTSFSTKRVFAPLRMTGTSWSAPAHVTSALATPHAYRNGAFVALPHASHAVYPAVDLHAPAGDLARFARAILRDGELDGARILSAKGVRAMLSADAHDAEQALGWQLRTIGSRRVVGHEGEDAGASTGLYLDLAAGTAAVVLANGDAFGSGERPRAEAIQTMISELLATSR